MSIFSQFGALVLLALVLFIGGLILYAYHVQRREHSKTTRGVSHRIFVVLTLWIVAVISITAGFRLTSLMTQRFTISEQRARLSPRVLLETKSDGQIHLDTVDDYAAWSNLQILVPKDYPPAPQWVVNVAGAKYGESVFDGLHLRGYLPAGDLQRLVGYSISPEKTESDAIESARQSALDQLAANVFGHAYPRMGLRDMNVPALKKMADPRGYASELDVLIEAKHVEKIPRPAGEFYRAAVLVRADGETLQHLAENRAQAEDITLRRPAQKSESRKLVKNEKKWPRLLTQSTSLAAIIVALWAFLSAGSRGAWAWPLRALSTFVLVVIYMFLYSFQV